MTYKVPPFIMGHLIFFVFMKNEFFFVEFDSGT